MAEAGTFVQHGCANSGVDIKEKETTAVAVSSNLFAFGGNCIRPPGDFRDYTRDVIILDIGPDSAKHAGVENPNVS